MKKITFLLISLFFTLTGYSQLGITPEGFENTAGPATTTWTLGTGNWAVFDNGVGTGNSWNINSTVATPPIVYAGLNSAFMNRENIGAGNTSEDYLATPLVTVPANGQLRFWTRSFTLGDQGTIYQIKVAPMTGSQVNPIDYNLVQQWTENSLNTTYNIYEQKVVSLSAYAGMQVYISFVMKFSQPAGQSGIGGDRWLVDNVQLVSQCLDPTTLTAIPAATTASLSWANPSGATSWEIEVIPAANTPTGVGVVYNGPLPYVVTGLTPNTPYKYYVRALCTGGIGSNTAGPFNFTTTTAPPACGGNFVDSGGPTGNYANGADLTTTICPTNAGDKVTVTFTAFNTESTYDGLYVFNGNSVAAPQIASANGAGNVPGGLAGSFWGTAIPGPFTSTATNGCLTFRFRSDGSINNPGWISNITCAPPPTCTRPTNLVAPTATVTTNSISLGWTQAANPNGSTPTAWQVLALPCGTPAPTATTTGFVAAPTNPFVLTGLTPDTCYDLYVRAVCSSTDLSLWSVSIPVTTQQVPPVCGGTFSDQGGASGLYPNNADNTVTICPTIAGQAVTVTFTTFNTQANSDGLYVFNGNSVAAPQITSANPAGTVPGGLAGSFWGTAIPGPFTSSAANGCLTFRFRSNATINAAGWTSNVTCATPPACPAPFSLTNTAVTITGATVAWNNPSNATTFNVLALPCGSPAPTAASTGFQTATANPFVMSGLNSATCYDVYVRNVCSPTSSSAWSTTPTTFTTLVAPPACGGNYVDNGGPTANYTNNADVTTTICPTIPGQIVTVTFTSFNTETSFDGLYVFDGNTIAAPQLASTNGPGNVPGALAGSYWGTAIPGPFTSSAANGCLTFRFRSDGSVANPGWIANITCNPPPTCPKPTNLTATSVTTTSAILGWTGPANAASWEVLVVPAGSPVPTATSLGITTSNPYTATGLTPGTSYTFYVRPVCSPTDTGLWSNGFNFSTTPINDECTTAIAVPVNQSLSCTQTTPGSLGGATASPQTTTCAGTPNDDVWFSFTATASTHTVSFNNLLPAVGINFGIFTGACGSLTQVVCVANTSGVINNLVPGTVYYIRVYTTLATPSPSTFNLCVGTVPCSEAVPFCTGQTLTYPNAVNVPNLGTIGCLGTSPNAAFFFLRVSQSGPLNYLMTQSTTPGGAANLDVDYALWGPYTTTNAACAVIPNSTPVSCSYSAAPTENFSIANAVVCQIYVVMITNFANQPGFITFTQTNTTGGGQTICYPFNAFNYSSNTYCQNAANQTPTLVPNATAGAYTASPSGLVINSTTGTINIAGSAPGTYIVTSTLSSGSSGSCPSIPDIVTTRTVIITPVPNATIAYAGSPYCNSVNAAQPVTKTGAGNGTYSSTTGLFISATTGAITPSLSTPGNYVVTYTVAATGGCPLYTTTANLTILVSPVVPQPANVVACGNYILPALTVGNYFTQTGGTGTQLAAGASITTSQTLFIYATNANCNNQKTLQISIFNTPAPTVSVAAQPTCAVQSGTIQVTAPVGANFQYSLDGGAFQSPVTFTGVAPGTHNVTVRNNTTTCVSPPTSVLINPIPLSSSVTTISYATPVCQNAVPTTVSPNTSATGFTTGGTYTATPAGLSINATTGVINLAASTANSYNVTYAVTQDLTICRAAGSTTVPFVNNPVITPVTTFSYTSPVCQNATTNPSPITGTGFTTGGTFSSTAGLTVNASTGVISLANSTPGTYSVTYSVLANTATCLVAGSTSSNITINPTVTPVTAFSYVSPVCAYNANPTPIPATGFTNGGTYTAAPTGLSINPSTGVVSLANSTAGTYVVTYSITADPATCRIAKSDTANLIVSPDIQSMISGECVGTQYVLTATPLNSSYSPTGVTYQWMTSSGQMLGTSATQNINVLGSYSVKVINTATGCFGTTTVNVTFLNCIIPNGISINGDGINDFWDLTGFNVKQVSIYNRYGMKVYSKKEYVKEWGGQQDNGNELPDGTYFYVLEFNGKETISGWVYINRALK